MPDDLLAIPPSCLFAPDALVLSHRGATGDGDESRPDTAAFPSGTPLSQSQCRSTLAAGGDHSIISQEGVSTRSGRVFKQEHSSLPWSTTSSVAECQLTLAAWGRASSVWILGTQPCTPPAANRINQHFLCSMPRHRKQGGV